MLSARRIYPVLQLCAIAFFVVGFLADDSTFFFALGALCTVSALVAFIARERKKTKTLD